MDNSGDTPTSGYEYEPVEGGDIQAEQSFPHYDFSDHKQPSLLGYAENPFNGYFLKGCKWSPDGTSMLTCCDNKVMRAFPLPQQFYTGDFSQPLSEMLPELQIKEGGTVYDYCWHPAASRQEPSNYCFITTSQKTPIHMWNSFTGELKATYKAINAKDEFEAAHSVAINPDGSLVYAGFRKMIRIFDINTAGSQAANIVTHKKRELGQFGIISCFAFLPSSNMFAAGSYSKSIALYDQRDNSNVMILEGHSGGVTQIKVSPDEHLLISGSRKDDELLIWDLRNPGHILAVLNRIVKTNQRMYFDIDPSARYICSGNHDGTVFIWDIRHLKHTDGSDEAPLEPMYKFQAHKDCVNACSFHPILAMVATSSGQRSYRMLSDSDSSNSDSDYVVENCVKLWWLGM